MIRYYDDILYYFYNNKNNSYKIVTYSVERAIAFSVINIGSRYSYMSNFYKLDTFGV